MGEGTAKGFRRRSFFGRLAGGLLAALGLGAARRAEERPIYLFPEPGRLAGPHTFTPASGRGIWLCSSDHSDGDWVRHDWYWLPGDGTWVPGVMPKGQQ